MKQTPATPYDPSLWEALPVQGCSLAPFAAIGASLLLTAGDVAQDPANYNAMTICWGALGVVWSRPAATVYVRNARETYRFMEANRLFTLSFLPREYDDKLRRIAGTLSGRDIDKAAEMGVTPISLDGAAAFDEAEEILVCDKLYADDLRPERFLSEEFERKVYRANGEPDYHRMYVGEVIKRYRRKTQ